MEGPGSLGWTAGGRAEVEQGLLCWRGRLDWHAGKTEGGLPPERDTCKGQNEMGRTELCRSGGRKTQVECEAGNRVRGVF